MKALMVPNAAETIRDTFGHVDDFNVIDTNYWTNAGSVGVVAGGRGGIADIDTAATDNVTGGLKGVEVHDLRNNAALNLKVFAKFAEAGSGIANVFIGLTSAASLDAQLADDGGGLPADWHGAGFYCLDGSTTMGVVSSVGTTAENELMTASNANNRTRELLTMTDASYRKYEIDIRPDGDGLLAAAFKIDDELIAVNRIVPAASPDPIGVLIGVKAGAATSETVLADWMSVQQVR